MSFYLVFWLSFSASLEQKTKLIEIQIVISKMNIDKSKSGLHLKNARNLRDIMERERERDKTK